MKDDTLTTGALFVGGGLAGYALGRVVIARWLDGSPATGTSPAAPAIATTSAAPALPATTPATAPTPTPAAPVQARPSPTPSRPTRPPSRPTPSETEVVPVTSPDQEERAATPSPEPEVGPVTSPGQVESPAVDDGDEARAERRPSRRYDRIFDMYRESIPIEYLRALARRESGMNPEEAKGPAWGLMQIVEVVRKDYNERHGTKYTRKDLLDPAISVAMCCWLLRFIITAYQKHHPDIPNMRANWDNPEFALLVTYGWNAGFSSSGGVIKVVRYLKQRGHTDVTMDLVHKHARAAGASRHLSNAKKVKWCRSVVRLYEQERAAPIAHPV